MKILICGFNDSDTISQTLESVTGHEVHYWDGRFKDFSVGELNSTDGTQDILKKFGAIYHEGIKGETQCQKRTRMFSILAEGEYGLKLDGDEVLLNPIQGLGDRDIYWGWMISAIYDYPFCKPFIFKKHEGMHYAGKHHYLFDEKNQLITSDQRTSKYTFKTLDFRVFNIRDRNTVRDSQKLSFLYSRSERLVADENDVYGVQTSKTHQHRAQAIRASADVLAEPTEHAPITFGLTFSRPWAMKRYFENFDKLVMPKCEMICVVDTDDRKFYRDIQSELIKRQGRFIGIKTFMTGNPAPQEKRMIQSRRLRTVRALHIILTEAKGKILLGGEDDSLPEPTAYQTLLQNLESCDVAQGTIVGRWLAIIPAWHVKEVDGQVVEITTGQKLNGLEEIQGMGWYCFAGYTNILRSVKLDWDLCQHIGADFHMGYYLWKAGYKILHNHDVHVTHFGEDFELTLGDNIIQIMWTRNGDNWTSKKL